MFFVEYSVNSMNYPGFFNTIVLKLNYFHHPIIILYTRSIIQSFTEI